MATANSPIRNYVYPDAAAFQKGERLHHSFYGTGTVLDVVHKGDSNIIVVELDDKTQTPIGVASPGRPDFDLWRGRTDILRLKYIASSNTAGIKPAEATGVKPATPVGLKPLATVGVKPVTQELGGVDPVGVKPVTE